VNNLRKIFKKPNNFIKNAIFLKGVPSQILIKLLDGESYLKLFQEFLFSLRLLCRYYALGMPPGDASEPLSYPFGPFLALPSFFSFSPLSPFRMLGFGLGFSWNK
jgi:hypothetical protein